MNGKIMSKQELLSFKLKAHLNREENRKAIAAQNKQRFEDEAQKLFQHISDLFADEAGIKIAITEPSFMDEDLNVGYLELDIVGKKVTISPLKKEGAMILETSGLVEGSLHFELDDSNNWRVVQSSFSGWSRLDDDFWFTKLLDLVP